MTVADYEWFIDESLLWVAEENGVVLAFSAADSRARASGRSSSTLRVRCRAEGFREVRVTLSTEPATRVEAFYRRAGWAEAGVTPHGEVIFTKSL